MNFPDCAEGPSVGPSHVVTGAVEAATSACAAASASPPAWAAIRDAATVIGRAAADALSRCDRPPTLSAVHAVETACLRNLLRVEAMLPLPSSKTVVQRSCTQLGKPRRECVRPTPMAEYPLVSRCVPPRSPDLLLLRRQGALS